MKKNCPFCCSEERILKFNDSAFVLLSNPRKTPGHLLVIPKRHTEKPWDLSSKELRDVFILIFYLQQRIIGKLGAGCDIRQNYRPFLQQGRLKVDHVHFHVIPRDFQDYIYQVSEKYETDLFADLDPDEASEVAKLIK